MIKLICTDIDGTLVKPGTDRINKDIFPVIRALKKQGILFAAASGRQCDSIEYLFQEVKEDIIFIGNNGGVVLCRDAVMSSHPISLEDTLEIIHDLRKIPGASILISKSQSGIAEGPDSEMADWLIEGYHCNIEVVEDIVSHIENNWDDQVYKISLYFKEGAEAVLEKYLLPKWENHPQIRCVCAGFEWIDFIDGSVNKGNAIKSIQEKLHILPEETMAFGDELNDIEMLQQAVHSFAVENARDEVKEVANYMAPAQEKDGVLTEIKKLLDKNVRENLEKKAIFFDVDGTLYETDKGISDNTKEAIQQLLKKGHIPIVNTGRTRASVSRELMEIGFKGVVAGCGTYVEYQNQVLKNITIEEDYLPFLMRRLKHYQVQPILESSDFLYFDKILKESHPTYPDMIHTWHEISGAPMKSFEENMERINKITIKSEDIEKAKQLVEEVKDVLYPIWHYAYGGFVELVPIGCNKASGVKDVIEHLDIPKENTYAFGDSNNDLEMLEYVAYGIAMGNSIDSVFARTKYRTERIEDNGIFKGLQKFGLI